MSLRTPGTLLKKKKIWVWTLFFSWILVKNMCGGARIYHYLALAQEPLGRSF